MKNKISDLRNLLFGQLEKLADEDTVDLEKEVMRSTSMVQIAQTIVDTARVEIEFVKATSMNHEETSGFFTKKVSPLLD